MRNAEFTLKLGLVKGGCDGSFFSIMLFTFSAIKGVTCEGT